MENTEKDMYCKKCGYKLEEGISFCGKCGEKVFYPDDKYGNSAKEAHTIQWLITLAVVGFTIYCFIIGAIWTAVCGVFISLFMCPEVFYKMYRGEFAIIGIVIGVIIGGVTFKDFYEDSKYINVVKDGYLGMSEEITVGDAFKDFFHNTKWEYKQDGDGNDIVKFEGKYSGFNGYTDSENKGTKKVEIRFRVEGDSFQIIGYKEDGKSRTIEELLRLLEWVY